MALEIKELTIRVTITETNAKQQVETPPDQKEEIIRECVRRVTESMERRSFSGFER